MFGSLKPLGRRNDMTDGEYKMFTPIYGYIAFSAISSVAITVMGITMERRADAVFRLRRKGQTDLLQAA